MRVKVGRDSGAACVVVLWDKSDSRTVLLIVLPVTARILHLEARVETPTRQLLHPTQYNPFLFISSVNYFLYFSTGETKRNVNYFSERSSSFFQTIPSLVKTVPFSMAVISLIDSFFLRRIAAPLYLLFSKVVMKSLSSRLGLLKSAAIVFWSLWAFLAFPLNKPLCSH